MSGDSDNRNAGQSTEWKYSQPRTTGSTAYGGYGNSLQNGANQDSLPSILSDARHNHSRSPPAANTYKSTETRVTSAKPLPSLNPKDQKAPPQPGGFKSSLDYVLAKARYVLGTDESSLYTTGSRYKQVYELMKDSKSLREVLKLVSQHLDLYTAKHRLDLAYDERSKQKQPNGAKGTSELQKLQFLAERIPQNEK